MRSQWLTVAEYAERMDLRPQTIRRKCRQGRLPATQINDRGDWLIHPSALRVAEVLWRAGADTRVAEIVATAVLLDELELPIADDELLNAVERLQISLRRLTGSGQRGGV
jgi:excisionase family DNA binding protein